MFIFLLFPLHEPIRLVREISCMEFKRNKEENQLEKIKWNTMLIFIICLWGNVYLKYVNYLPDNLNSKWYLHMCDSFDGLFALKGNDRPNQTESANINCNQYTIWMIVDSFVWVVCVLVWVCMIRCYRKYNMYLSSKSTQKVHGTADENEQSKLNITREQKGI